MAKRSIDLANIPNEKVILFMQLGDLKRHLTMFPHELPDFSGLVGAIDDFRERLQEQMEAES